MEYSLDRIREMAEGDEEFVHSVISVFLEEIPADLEGLGAAVNSGDFEQIYKLSHKIKPNVDMFGMERTRALALEMETMGKNASDLQGIRDRFPHLKRNIMEVIEALQNDYNP